MRAKAAEGAVFCLIHGYFLAGALGFTRDCLGQVVYDNKRHQRLFPERDTGQARLPAQTRCAGGACCRSLYVALWRLS